MGKAKDAALGVDHYMRVGSDFKMPSLADGVHAIVQEIEANGTDRDRDNLDYILNRHTRARVKKSSTTTDFGAIATRMVTFWSRASALTARASCLEMSTTTSLRVAAEYAKSDSSLSIFKIATQSFLQRGADLAFLSAFPGEDEFLLPPLTAVRRQRIERGTFTPRLALTLPL